MASCHTWTPEEDLFIFDNYLKLTAREIAKILGDFTRHQIRGRYIQIRKMFYDLVSAPLKAPAETPTKDAKPSVTWEGSDNSQVVTTTSSTVRTLDGAIKAANVNTEIWDVERFVVNKWDVVAKTSSTRHRTKVGKGWEGKQEKWTKQLTATELWQVKLWLKRKAGDDKEQVANALIDQMKLHAPDYSGFSPVKIDTDRDRYMLELSIPDLHLGKLCWDKETGTNYNSKIAQQMFMDAVDHFIRQTKSMQIEQILFPLGNDLLNVDNARNETTAGTRQDCDTRWQKSFVRARMMIINAIDRLGTIAPVVVPIVPGNHDREKMFHIGDTLCSWYHKTDHVTIDNAPNIRKYVSYGVNLIGLTHGSEEKHANLPLIMATEEPKLWSQSTWREWHLGHFHKRSEHKFVAGDTFNGVSVRVLPSLSGTDAWHHSKGYTKGHQSAEAYLWHHTDGYAGHLSWNAK